MGTMIIKYLQDGKLLEREMTPEEIAEAEKAMQQQIEADKNKPPTLEEQMVALQKQMETTQSALDFLLLGTV